jgi:hypothetical protein
MILTIKIDVGLSVLGWGSTWRRQVAAVAGSAVFLSFFVLHALFKIPCIRYSLPFSVEKVAILFLSTSKDVLMYRNERRLGFVNLV